MQYSFTQYQKRSFSRASNNEKLAIYLSIYLSIYLDGTVEYADCISAEE